MFSAQLKKYGDLIINFKYSNFKPIPTSIDYPISRGLYWVDNANKLIDFPPYSTVIIKKTLFN